jgi:anti-anti-sigma regulatory factor
MSEPTGGQPRTLVHVEGDVDAIVARQLFAMVARCGPGSRLVLDFSHAHEIADYGLGLLARALVKAPQSSIAVRGLSRHQERVLRYFGVDEAMVNG